MSELSERVVMVQSPNIVWKTMSKKDYHQFATAVFFLFAAIGPLTLLMESTIIQASWIRLFVMTILCGLFSWTIVMSLNKTKLVSMVTAGHPPILHYNLVIDTIEEHRTHNLALGISPTAVFESKIIPFRTNDIFCFVTDGLMEAANAKNQQFGMERVKSLIRNAPGRSAEKMNSDLIESVQQFATDRELSDDITTVISRIL